MLVTRQSATGDISCKPSGKTAVTLCQACRASLILGQHHMILLDVHCKGTCVNNLPKVTVAYRSRILGLLIVSLILTMT